MYAYLRVQSLSIEAFQVLYWIISHNTKHIQYNIHMDDAGEKLTFWLLALLSLYRKRDFVATLELIRWHLYHVLFDIITINK
jgi:hypothetical protein